MAEQTALTRFDYVWVAEGGDLLLGTVIGDSLAVGDTVDAANGYYLVYDAEPAPADAVIGTVVTTWYYDADSGLWAAAEGGGSGGLGSESGWAYAAELSDPFGPDQEADLGEFVYYFIHYSAWGDIYYGYVFDDGTYGYQEGHRYDDGYSGEYYIYASDPLGTDVWYTGYVGIYGQYFDEYSLVWGYAFGYGWDGLGSETGWAYLENSSTYSAFSPETSADFVYYWTPGSDIYSYQLNKYFFTYYSDSGDTWTGYVYDDGSYGYEVGDWLRDPMNSGYYYIYDSTSYYGSAHESGEVWADGGDYFDAETGRWEECRAYGENGLGSENGYASIYRFTDYPFGFGNDADLPADIQADAYYFTYYDASGDIYSGVYYYTHIVGSLYDGGDLYDVGQVITTTDGSYYVITAVETLETGNHKESVVAMNGAAYYDAQTGTWGTAYGYSFGSLGTETGFVVDAAGNHAFFDAESGADLIATSPLTGTAVYRFEYVLASGDWFEGYVVDDGSYWDGLVETDANGATITYSYAWSVESTVLEPGTAIMAFSSYYDADTGDSGYVLGTGSSGALSASGRLYSTSLGWHQSFTAGTEGDLLEFGYPRPAMPETATRYSFVLVAEGDDLLFGTVVDDGSLGYAVGDTVEAGLGYYLIYDSEAADDAAAAGTVATSWYYDADTDTWAMTEGGGAAGLGSESGRVVADGASGWFGYGNEEADLESVGDRIYLFIFAHDDGDLYYGYVYDDGTYGYSVDQLIETESGQYTIYDSYALGYDSPYTGYIGVSWYYDDDSSQWSYAFAYGWGGIASETGWAYTENWAVYDLFGFGVYEADLTVLVDTVYWFRFTDDDGDVYYGYVYDDGTYGYAVGDVVEAAGGQYAIYDATDLGYDSDLTGYVGVSWYYDAGTAQWAYALGYGWTGLGSELGWAYTESWALYDWFAYGEYEADLGDIVYYFVHYAASGDIYYGYVFDDGSYGYRDGQTIDDGYGGQYVITGAAALYEDVWYTGYVGVYGYYYDSGLDAWSYAVGYGWGGLGAEWGWAYTEDWVTYDWFGAGKEAAVAAPDTIYYFYFYEDGGDYYNGTVYDDGRYGYYVGQQIAYGTGFYFIYDSYEVGSDTAYTGQVSVDWQYYDADSDSFGVSEGQGEDGLGSESGTVTSADGQRLDRFSPEDDADIGEGASTGADHIYYFYYFDDSGDSYAGYVFDDGTYGYAVGDWLRNDSDTGYYYIYHGGSFDQFAKWPGEVFASGYYDAQTGQWASFGATGSDGLGSETGYVVYSYGWYEYETIDFAAGVAIDLPQTKTTTAYSFTYYDDSGDIYFGILYDVNDEAFAGTEYEYEVGDIVTTSGETSYYVITAVEMLEDGGYFNSLVAIDGTPYYDAETQTWGTAYGWSGNGFWGEVGYAYDSSGHYDLFGTSDDADFTAAAANLDVYRFEMQMTTGDYYSGLVVSGDYERYYDGLVETDYEGNVITYHYVWSVSSNVLSSGEVLTAFEPYYDADADVFGYAIGSNSYDNGPVSDWGFALTASGYYDNFGQEDADLFEFGFPMPDL